jgi:tetratricopeptide (TPR) repeat protein
MPPVRNPAGFGDPALQSEGVGRSEPAPLQGDATLIAGVVALLWTVHPLQTESVTYVSQRSESLMGLFCLLTLYGFIRSVKAESRNCWLVLSVAACFCGMATKQVMVTAPVLVLLYDRAFVSGSFRSALTSRRWYYAGLAATWFWLGFLMHRSSLAAISVGFQAGVSWTTYAMTELRVVTDYLKLALWPHPLVFDYGVDILATDPLAAAPYAFIIAAILAGVVIACRRAPGVGFLGCWFFLVLAPTSTVVPVAAQPMAESRMYLPLAAVVALAVTGLYAMLGRRSLVLWPVLAVGLGWLTFVRNETYGSELALWRDTVAKVPRSARARYNLGIVYSQQGQYAQAVEQDEAGLLLDDGWAAAGQAPAAHNKLGYDLAALGRVPEAVAHYEQALRLRPDYALAHLNLARALVRLDRYPEAIRHFEEALRLKIGGPEAAEAELGDALIHEGRVEEAIVHCRAALRAAPTWAPGFNNLAYALLLTGRVDEAIATYREAARLDPLYAAAWVGLGYALIQAGRPAEAIAPCREAVRLQPGFADAHNTLGIAFAQTGRTKEAIACFEQALRLDADKADVHNNLGNALAAAGCMPEAIVQYREALRSDPDYAPAHRNLGTELRRAGREAEAAEHFAAAARLETAAERR